jgi:hypothetical protein
MVGRENVRPHKAVLDMCGMRGVSRCPLTHRLDSFRSTYAKSDRRRRIGGVSTALLSP